MKCMILLVLFFVQVFCANTPNSLNNIRNDVPADIKALLSKSLRNSNYSKKNFEDDLKMIGSNKEIGEKLPLISDNLLKLNGSIFSQQELDTQLLYLCIHETRTVEQIECSEIHFTVMQLHFLKLFLWKQKSVKNVNLRYCSFNQEKCNQKNISVPPSVLFSVTLESFKVLSRLPGIKKLELDFVGLSDLLPLPEIKETEHLKNLEEFRFRIHSFKFWELNFESFLNLINKFTSLKILKIIGHRFPPYESLISAFDKYVWKKIFTSNTTIEEVYFYSFVDLASIKKIKSKDDAQRKTDDDQVLEAENRIIDSLEKTFPQSEGFEHDRQERSFCVKRKKIIENPSLKRTCSAENFEDKQRDTTSRCVKRMKP